MPDGDKDHGGRGKKMTEERGKKEDDGGGKEENRRRRKLLHLTDARAASGGIPGEPGSWQIEDA